MKNNRLILSKRLQALVDLVTSGMSVVDVGCDHGFVSIALVQQGKSKSVLAMDVRTGPLNAAREHIAEWEMEDYIQTRLSDGLEAYREGEAESAIIAGMGGRLMMGILEDSRAKVDTLSELILQPQSELPAFRHYLYTGGYQVLEEHILLEEEKYYFLFRVSPLAGEKPEQSRTEADFPEWLGEEYGRGLLIKRDPLLHQYLVREKHLTEEILAKLSEAGTEKANKRLPEMKSRLEGLKMALDLYQ